MEQTLEELADWAETQWNKPEAIPEILEHAPELTVADAYRVQRIRMEKHGAAGDRIIGYKAALTSKSMQKQTGIGEPVLGTLLASRTFPEL